MARTEKDVEILLPLENLISTLCKLPPEDLREVKLRIEKQLEALDQFKNSLGELEDKEFWDSELGREIIVEADDTITREEVLRITSKYKGSMAADISAERDER